MKKISKEEQDWIINRLKIYEIKYVEVYDEIYDHIFSGIEAKRRQGDTRDISPIFQDIMDEDFGSHRGIERMTNERVSAVQDILSVALKREIFQYFKLSKGLLFLGIVVLFAWVLSLFHLQEKYVFLVLMALSFIPVIYLLLFQIKHNILLKKSLVSGYMAHLTYYLVFIFNLFLYVVPFAMLFFMEADDLNHSREVLFGFLGVWGMSLLAIFIFIYTRSIAKVIQTDYKRMVREILPMVK